MKEGAPEENTKAEEEGGLLANLGASKFGRALAFTAAIGGAGIATHQMAEEGLPQGITIESMIDNPEILNREMVIPDGIELTPFTSLAKELHEEIGRPATVAEVQAADVLSREGRGEQLRALVQVMKKGKMDGVGLTRDYIGRGDYKTNITSVTAYGVQDGKGIMLEN